MVDKGGLISEWIIIIQAVKELQQFDWQLTQSKSIDTLEIWMKLKLFLRVVDKGGLIAEWIELLYLSK